MKKILNFSLIIVGIFTLFFSFNNSTSAQSINAPCKVKNAYFQPAGFQNDDWYDDENKPTVKAVVETENCTGKKIEFSITSTKNNADTDVSGFDNVELPIPPTGLLEITFKAGEDECFQNETIDCNFYIDLDNSFGGIESDYSSKDKTDGEISYNCDTDILFGIGGTCDENFEFVGIGGGNVRAIWFFFGTSVSDQRGPFDDITACNQARADFKTLTGSDSNSRCFFKLTFDPTPPPATPFTPGTSSYDNTYELLAPIPGVVPGNVVGPDFNLGNYVNNLIKVIIGLASAMAVFMIVFGGIEWMMSDSFISKGQGKKRIFDAIKGLVLALGSYLILITINPDLVIIDFRLDKQTIKVEFSGDTNVGIPQTGISCPPGVDCNIPNTPNENLVYSIVSKLNGKTTYRFGGKGTPPPYQYETKECPPTGPCKTFCPPGTICLDCSGFVNFVLRYSGYKEFNGGTQTIFSNAERVISMTDNSVNGTALKPGDLLGWTSGNRHVLIYVGNGKVADSHGGSGREPGKAIGIYSTTEYKDKIKFIKRVEPR